ncbi:MAG: AAA-associated domain-containing protein [Nitrososphaerales archaeon]
MLITKIRYSHMIGLLEVLEGFGGRVDVAKIADDMSLELDDLLPVIEVAELLGFVMVDSGDLVLKDEGSKFLSDGARGRKKRLGERLLMLETFKKLVEFIDKREEKYVTKEELLDFLMKMMPEADSEATLRSIIDWGRHGLLLKYNSKEDKIRLT